MQFGLIGSEAVAGEEQPGGLGEDEGVEGGAATLDVPEVELDALLPGNAGATADLGPAGDPGQDVVATALARRVVPHLRRDRRARPADRHLAAQDIEEVGD